MKEISKMICKLQLRENDVCIPEGGHIKSPWTAYSLTAFIHRDPSTQLLFPAQEMMLLKSFAFAYLWLLFAALASLASSVPVSLITGLTQANYKLAWLIDSQDWTAFDTVVAQNVTFDGTDLLPAKGGIANGLDEVIEVFQHDAADGARTSHLVANVLVMETYGRSRARVNS